MPDEPAPDTPDGPLADARGLCVRIASGDEEALTGFYHHWRGHVEGVAKRSLGEDASVPDVTQEVFVRVIRKMPVLDTHRAVGAWLTTTTHRCAVDTLRAKQRRDRDVSYDPGASDASTTVQDHFQDAIHLLEESEDELRSLIEARVRFGWTLDRIGRTFGLTPSAVDGRINRALRKMRGTLREGEHA